ncbi:MAG: hypothetical protein E7277_00720 [Lachnospiraceae bacterium]|nr:hypothetical protein [Lachnospiraceae bacterium]
MRTISPTGGRGDAAVVIGATACGLNSSIGRFRKGRFAFLRDRQEAGLDVWAVKYLDFLI